MVVDALLSLMVLCSEEVSSYSNMLVALPGKSVEGNNSQRD